MAQFVAGVGVIVGLSLWLFKLFGENWLSNKFAERLEAFKHDQQKEIEHLRFEINKLFDRTTKLHQREFEVLPEAWSLLAQSYHTVKGLTAGFQSYPDIDRMSASEIDEFLSKIPLENWQKEELKKADDKNGYYQNAISWYRLGDAREVCRKSAVFILKNGIFMPPGLKEKFDKLDELSWMALTEHQNNKQHRFIPAQRDALTEFLNVGGPLMKELEAEVKQRLWGSAL